MNRRRRGGIVDALAALAVLGALVGLATACDSTGSGPATVSTADAYVAAIRWYVDQIPAPEPTQTTDSVETGPTLVYIAPADGNPIDASSQAAVVSALSDMADSIEVRFADVRDDAIDVETELEPVKEGGALLLVGKVAKGTPPVEVSIEVYHDIDHDESFQMRIVRVGADEFTVTAVTELGQS
ncbi:MAG: hypothetical protein ABIR32_09435 [Ilumatobacteraceae bacterium]